MAIGNSLCSSEGHKLQSYRFNDRILPVGGVQIVAAQYGVFCSACGIPLEQLQEQEKAVEPKKRIRKPKPIVPVFPDSKDIA